MAPTTSLNAEWATWVQEASDHAAANGSRSCDTYKRAARAIRLHNQALHHPKQALALVGVGEGVVRLLTARLREKCNDTGDPFPTEPASLKDKRKNSTGNANRPKKRARASLTAEERALDSCSSNNGYDDQENAPGPSNRTKDTSTTGGQSKKKGNPRKPRRRKGEQLTAAERALDDCSSDDNPQPPAAGSKTTSQPSPPRPKSRTSTTTEKKKYIPKRRTGCWGILVALAILTTERTGPFTKQEIIEHAQEYCESSYTERGSRGGGAGNSGHYTAWNMKKLLAEGLSLSKPGRPAKFTLTQPGFEVASILAEKEDLSLVPFDKSKLPVGDNLTIIDNSHNLDEFDSVGEFLLPMRASSSKAPPTKNPVNTNTRAPLNASTSCDLASSQKPRNTIGNQPSFSQRNRLPTNPTTDSAITCSNTNSNQSSNRLPHHRGPFEFWYLNRAGLRVRTMDDADTQIHPRTYETLYQIEFSASQSSHPVKRNSIVDEDPLRPTISSESGGIGGGHHMIGWMYEGKAIPNCPGFGLSTHSPTLSTSTVAPTTNSLPSSNINIVPQASSSIPLNDHRPHPPSPDYDPTINDIQGEDEVESYFGQLSQTPRYQSTISPPERLFKPSSSGSITPAGGSVPSIDSEAEQVCTKPATSLGGTLRPNMHNNRSGSCEIVLSGRTGLSATVVGWSASNSPDDHHHNQQDVSENSISVSSNNSNCRSLIGNLKRTMSNNSSENQPTHTSSVLGGIPSSNRTLVPLKRTPSNFSDNLPSTIRKPSDDGIPSSRTFVNLKRIPSTFSESQSSIRRSSAGDGLPSRRTLVNLKRTSSTLSENLFSKSTQTVMDFQPEVWKAGSYDIVLVLDHREVRAVNDREAFFKLCVDKADALNSSFSGHHENRNPVRVVQRALVLGDAIWIAVNHLDNREVVLDSIVERKRLDDLCASIKDNRFEEQKARLKRSGLRDPIYLVEAYNSHSNHESNGQMIYTSKFETMLLNDFQLEATADWKASVEFLIRRTEVLRDLHRNIDLSIIPESEIDRTTYLSKLSHLRTMKEGEGEDGEKARYWVTEYNSFEMLNHKSATLTVRELWARMIHCLPGMSASKVTSFVEHWPTPIEFWNDIKSHDNKDNHNTLDPSNIVDKHPWSWIDRISNSPIPSSSTNSNLEDESFDSLSGNILTNNSSSTSSRIGPALSKRLWELYTLSSYDSESSRDHSSSP
ncbi:hypothetical protein MJO28_009269 [Puccinia striiformis f. sp. tritici]|uniref:Uncharacterized protein n=1 Tax=Puccinia striiformis f. sp. tritici TaxID=168172 RepID=A0ACC0E739_9BASI|nr:hypothetical protein MJO28_009269 [Puccinia striiformis f. sp. tritici]